MRRLLELWRRRELALELLDEYDRDSQPVNLDRSMRLLSEYIASGNWSTERRSVDADTWRRAVEAKADQYRGGAA